VRFEEVEVGDRLPELVRGPLREPHLMRWSAAIENWHRIHYDQAFTTEHDGLPGLLVNGSWKQHFLLQLVRGWAEPEGWVRRIGFEFRAMDLVGTTLTAWGEVLRVDREGEYGVIDLRIGIRNENERESTPGTATVVLPMAGGPAVPYPFPRS
jgi:acyl dehydratase